jgi:Tfp pilus assembly protein PilX
MYTKGLEYYMATGSNQGKGRDKSSQGLSVFLALVVLLVILILAIGALASYIVWSGWSQHQADLDRQVAEAAQHEHDRLIRTDPIVGLWQSHDASFENSAELFDDLNLTIYNDHTYVIYNRVNGTSTHGTWEKTGNFYTTDIYTVHEEGKTFPPTTISHGLNSGHIQYTYMYRDSPPNAILTFINYDLVDYYTK